MNTTLSTIEQWLEERNEPAFRKKQIEHAWYAREGWEGVTTLPAALRSELAHTFPWLSLIAKIVLTSPKDGTHKALLACTDGALLETVLMPNARSQWTACISSQVGCGMGCTFCATGTMGLKRNLTVDEIVDQIRFWHVREPAAKITNIVFMGMGEPLANYGAVKRAAETFITHMGFGATRITLSTVGFKAGLDQLLADTAFPPVRLALSIHAGTDETRSKIVPSHRGTSMKTLAAWVKAYVAKYGNRRHYLTLEYVMLWGVNDSPEEAKALAKLFVPIHHRVKLNLIPWNPISGELKTSSLERLEAFKRITENAGITTTIRYSKGLDISAACGQLVVKTAKV